MVTNSQILDVLSLARELQRNGHCRGTMATRPHGRGRIDCNVDHPEADRFCLMGALSRAAWELSDGPHHQYRELLETANTLVGAAWERRRDKDRYPCAVGLNDDPDTPLHAVLNLYDQAARLVGKG